MVVLADEILESFFESDFSSTFKLEPVPDMELPNSNTGLLGGIWASVASDGNKKIFNRFTDEVGKSIGKHQVGTGPSHVYLQLSLIVITGLPPSSYWQVHRIGGAQGTRIPSYAHDAPFRLQSQSQILRERSWSQCSTIIRVSARPSQHPEPGICYFSVIFVLADAKHVRDGGERGIHGTDAIRYR